MKFTAEFEGTTATRSSKTRTYTHATWVRLPATWWRESDRDALVVARWSMTEAAASKPLADGWETHRVATTTTTH